MQKTAIDSRLRNLRIASPCSVAWEGMHGDDRVRQCDACQLSVYNISSLSGTEAIELITKRQGRLCVRLFQRPDGTLITEDCPVGLRRHYKRVSRLTGAVITSIIGLFSIGYGQKQEKAVDASKLKVIRTLHPGQAGTLSGYITDENGAVIPGVIVKVYRNKEKIGTFESDSDGNYVIKGIPAGNWRMIERLPY